MYKYVITTANGDFRTEIQFTNHHGNPEQVSRYFRSYPDAIRSVENHMFNWIKDMLNRYIHHAEILALTGHKAFYRTIRRTESLDKCLAYLEIVNRQESMNLEKLCYSIRSIKNELRDILPSPGNSSYQSSENKLLEIICAAKTVLQSLVPEQV